MIATASIDRVHRWMLSILLVLLVTQESLSLKVICLFESDKSDG